MYVNLKVQEGKRKKYLLSHHDFHKPIALSWINPEAIHYSKVISLSRKRGRYTEDTLVASTITMYKFNSSNTRDTAVKYDSVASISNLSRIRLDTTLDNYLDIGKKSARCSVHRWLGIDSERHTYYCSSCNVNMCVLYYRIFHQVPELLSQKSTLKHKYTQLINKYNNNK